MTLHLRKMTVYGSLSSDPESRVRKPPKLLVALVSLTIVASIGVVTFLNQTEQSVLAAGDARETRPLMNDVAQTKVGDIAVDNRIDNGFLESPLVDVNHASCNKDTDPDCETSVNPVFDKQEVGGKVLARSTANNIASSKSARTDSSSKPSHGFSTSAADNDLAEYFRQQALKSKVQDTRVQYKTDQLSSKRAEEELNRYFQYEQKLAATKQTVSPLHQEQSVKKEAAPKFGISTAQSQHQLHKYFSKLVQPSSHSYVGFSGTVADNDLNKYFSSQLSAVSAEASIHHGITSSDSRIDLARYFRQMTPPKSAKISADAVFSRVKDHAVDAPKEIPASARRMSSNAANTDLKAYFDNQASSKKHPVSKMQAFPRKQQLAAYGVGAEDDNAVEVGKAYGVSKVLPGPPVFGANKAPNQKNIDEVNEAIKAQQFDGYTNGNGGPVSPIVFPSP